MRTLVVVLLVGVLAASCTDEELVLNEHSAPILAGNRLAVNRLAVNRLAVNRLAVNRLAVNRLAVNRLAVNRLAARELLETEGGREVLTFIVSCAVPSGITLVAQQDGVTYEFPGEIGLAEGWLRHSLDEEGQGWVSACLFARVNANNVTVPISMRGPHPALAVTDDEAAEWSVEEGAFYGNYFNDRDEPIDWNACRGADQADGESGGLVDRDCAEPDPARPGRTICGFRYAGDCGDFARRYACESFSDRGTYYRNCHDSATERRGHDHRHGPGCGHTYRQVITTFVVP